MAHQTSEISESFEESQAGWWWLEHVFFFFYIWGRIIIPIDFHIFQRGRYTTNQQRFWAYCDILCKKVCGPSMPSDLVFFSELPSWPCRRSSIGDPVTLSSKYFSDFLDTGWILLQAAFCDVSEVCVFEDFKHFFFILGFTIGVKNELIIGTSGWPRMMWSLKASTWKIPDTQRMTSSMPKCQWKNFQVASHFTWQLRLAMQSVIVCACRLSLVVIQILFDVGIQTICSLQVLLNGNLQLLHPLYSNCRYPLVN